MISPDLLLYYSLWFILLLAAGWYPCCNTVSPPCSYCTSEGITLSVAYASYSNDDSTSLCDCTWFNTTYILTQTSGDPCKWTNNTCYVDTCPGSPDDYDMCIFIEAQTMSTPLIGYIGWDIKATHWTDYADSPLTDGSYSDNVRHVLDITTNSSFDCTTTRSIPYYVHHPGPPVVCRNLSSVTCQVN